MILVVLCLCVIYFVMAKDYKYGDIARVDALMEEYTTQGYRPGKVAKLAREMAEIGKKINEALEEQRALRDKIKPLCTHAVEDLIYSEYYITDTIGSNGYTNSYMTCKMCGEELMRKQNG